MEQSVRYSAFKDYVALDFISKTGQIIKTPFYLQNKWQVEVHWATPSNERCDNPIDYDDFHHKYLFKMVDGKLFVSWLNGPCFDINFSEVKPKELIDWRFQYATKIKKAEKIIN